ncbi:MAG: hypothetical protein ACRD2H_11770 [Terriglobales bacterium]
MEGAIGRWPLLHDHDREKAKRVMTAMLKMLKLDIGELQRAYEAE